MKCMSLSQWDHLCDVTEVLCRKCEGFGAEIGKKFASFFVKQFDEEARQVNLDRNCADWLKNVVPVLLWECFFMVFTMTNLFAIMFIKCVMLSYLKLWTFFFITERDSVQTAYHVKLCDLLIKDADQSMSLQRAQPVDGREASHLQLHFKGAGKDAADVLPKSRRSWLENTTRLWFS